MGETAFNGISMRSHIHWFSINFTDFAPPFENHFENFQGFARPSCVCRAFYWSICVPMAVVAPEYRLRCCCLLVRSLFKCSAVNKSLFCVAAPYELKATKTYANRTILMLLVSICMRANFTMLCQRRILNAFVHPVYVCVNGERFSVERYIGYWYCCCCGVDTKTMLMWRWWY